MNDGLFMAMELIELTFWVALGFAPTLSGLLLAGKVLHGKSGLYGLHPVLRKEVAA